MPAPLLSVEPKLRRLAEAVVLALVASRMWTKRGPVQQPQPLCLSDGCRYEPEPKRRGLVIVSMLAAAAGALGFGKWLYPPADTEPDLLAPFVLGFPLLVNDGRSTIPLWRVGWFETHGESAGLHRFEMDREGPLPDYVPGTVRALLWTNWDAPVAQDVAITMTITLPPGAKVASCSGPRVECHPVPRPRGPEAPEFTQGDCVEISVPIRTGEWTAAAVVDITGSKGIAVTTSRTRARVQYPALNPSFEHGEKWDDFGAGFATQVGAILPEVAGYGWTPEPGLGPADSAVAWERVIPLWPNAASSSEGWRMAGARNGILRHDAQRTFAAGIAFGVGGSALIVLLQAVVEAIRVQPLKDLLRRAPRRSR